MPVAPMEQLEKTRSRSSRLKYYIHDSADYFRIQLVGELERADLAELDGCWCTAKSSVGNRKIVLDLRGLTAVDEDGRQWLAAMARQGALFADNASKTKGLNLTSNWTLQTRTDHTTPSFLSRLLHFNFHLSWLRCRNEVSNEPL